MLRLENLCLELGGFSLRANWSVGSGQILGVIGPSGAGKSTLLAALGGFLRPTSGRIVWEGEEITHLPPGDRPCATLFQDNNLFPHLTILQNLGLALRKGVRLRPEDKDRAETVLEKVGLAGMGNRRPADLSGGQQGRAALARVLLQERPIVLLDEPFAALGPGLKQEMLDLLEEVLRDRLVLMVTHDPKDVKTVAPMVSIVARGEASPPARTDALFSNPPEALRRYLGDARS